MNVNRRLFLRTLVLAPFVVSAAMCAPNKRPRRIAIPCEPADLSGSETISTLRREPDGTVRYSYVNGDIVSYEGVYHVCVGGTFRT